MPIALNPNSRFDVHLQSDAELPENERPTFIFKNLNCDEWARVANIIDEMDEAGTGGVAIGRMIDAIRLSLVDWRNMGSYEYDPAKLGEIINVSEARELMDKVLRHNTATSDLLGKSE